MDVINERLSEVEKRLVKLEKWSHEPFDFTNFIQRLEALEKKAGIEPPIEGEPDYDCDFYYFKPESGKWKYHGEGMFPDNEGKEGWYEVDHQAIHMKNGGMPGISGTGTNYTIVVIPKEHCKAKFAYPRMIKATEGFV